MFFYIYFILFSLLSTGSDYGFSEYPTKLEVPEPLFVDLVRGLNAEKGEWEINTLFAHSQGYFRDVEWAPEVEWVLSRGTAIEFEFPMVGDSLYAYKFAFQKKIFEAPDNQTIHGFQLIYEAESKFQHSEGTLFYILAHRWSHEVSTILLTGARQSLQHSSDPIFLWNQTFFYNHSREVDLGVELNLTTGHLSERFLQVMPQLHLSLKRGYKIQFGYGGREDLGRWGPASVLRVIKEFNHP